VGLALMLLNMTIEKILNEEKPKIDTLSDDIRNQYVKCLKALSIFVSEDFFDIPRLIGNKYEQEGYFYEIPYFDSEQLWESNNQIMLIVVYKIENKTSCCPLRIDMKVTDENNWSIYVYDQSGDRTIKRTFLENVQGVYYTEIVNYSSITLWELLKEGVGFEEISE